MPTKYRDYYEVSKLQAKIMKCIDDWTHSKKTPISRKEIAKQMLLGGVTDASVKDALLSLLQKGYIRKAVMISNKTYYVQLRRVNGVD